MTSEAPTLTDTIEHSREWLDENRHEGVSCPSCEQYVKVYRRTINGGMVRTLATMYQKAGLEFVHVPSLKVDTNHEVSQLAWRGLVEEEKRVREDGGRAGFWKVTLAGALWLKGMTSAPKYAIVYNNKVLELTEDDTVRVTDVKTKNFNLQEIIGND
jgi:hypothetical protein